MTRLFFGRGTCFHESTDSLNRAWRCAIAERLSAAAWVRALCGVFAGCRRGKLARGERALRIALAPEEHRASATASLHELALATLGADHAGLLVVLLDVLAVRVAGASDERTKPAAALRERLPALGAGLALEG